MDIIVYSQLKQVFFYAGGVDKKTSCSSLVCTVLSKLHKTPKDFQQFYMQGTNVLQSFYIT